MNNPFFSIVIPAYNCEDTIADTINSILLQKFQNYEITIVNDGSTDQTHQIISEFDDNRIKIITIANGGPGNARNIGINESSGQYLIFVDSDDILEVNLLSSRVEMLKEKAYDLIVGSYVTRVMDGVEVVDEKVTQAPDLVINSNSEFLGNIYPLMEQQLLYVIWNKVYKLDVVKKYNIQFPPYRSCEDRLFNLAYFKYTNQALITSKVLYMYSFDGKNSLTNKYFDNKFKTFEEFFIESVKLVPNDLAGFSSLFLKGTMSCFIPLHSYSCQLNFSEKRKYIKVALQNQNLIRAARAAVNDGLMKKVFKYLFNVRSISVHFTVSWILYQLSNLNPKIIEKLKRNF